MIIILLLLIIGIQFQNSKNTVSRTDFFSKAQCNALRGIACLYILFCHAHMTITFDSVLLWPILSIDRATIWSNGLFFFISGYGLWISSQNKANYLAFPSLIKRLSSLAIPAILAYILYLFIPTSITNSRSPFAWFHFDDVVWFIIELFFLYILFWFIFGFIGKYVNSSLILLSIMFCIILIWDIIAFVTGRGLAWYASTLCFPLGILVSLWKSFSGKPTLANNAYSQASISINNKFATIPASKTVIISLVALIIAVITYFFYRQLPNFSLLGFLILANVSTLAFCIFVFYISSRVCIGNRATNFLGSISYEIYLVHLMTLKVMREFNIPNAAKIYLSILICIITALIIHIIASKIIQTIHTIIR